MSKYRSPLRESQSQSTRDRIAEAVFAVFQRRGGHQEITFKDVAKEAEVTEMTVYRHFPKKEDLMRVLWEGVNSRIGIRIPETIEELIGRNQDLHLAYERLSPLILESITSKQGRELRLSHKSERQNAFLKIANEVNPALTPKEKRHLGSVLQLLHSSYAWDSMRSNWEMNPKEIADVTRIAMEAVIASFSQKEKP